MRTQLTLFIAISVLMVAGPCLAAPAVLPPLQRNFFTTNPAPVVDVLAGSNATVQATTVGTDTRHFTVNGRTDTNVVNILIAAGGDLTAATNNDLAMGLNATNQSLLIGANGTNDVLRIGLAATNNDLAMGASATNQSLLIGANATNDVLRIGLAATNNDLAMGLSSTNQSLLIGANATNNDLLIGLNLTNLFGTLIGGSSNITDSAYEAVIRNGRISTNLNVESPIGTNWLAGTNYFGGTNSVGGPTNALIVLQDRVQLRNIKANGTNIMYIDPATGALLWNTDSKYDIGANGANRPYNIWSANSILAQGSCWAITGGIGIQGKTYFTAGDPGSIKVSATDAIRDRLVIQGPVKTLTDATATGIFTITARTNSFVGGTIDYTIHCASTDHRQILSGIVTYAGVNTNGIWQIKTCTENASNQALAATDGTLSTTWTMDDAASGGTTNVTIKCSADTSLTPAANQFYILWQLRNNGTNTITAL